METKQKECEICGVWFTPSRSSQKYCPECGKDPTKAWRDLHKHMQYSVARVGTGRPVSKTEVEFETSTRLKSRDSRTPRREST